MVELDYDVIISHSDELNSLTCYVPLVLHSYIDSSSYLGRVSDDVAQEYYKNRTALMGAKDYNKFLTDDLLKWLKEHDEFKDIIKE